MELLHIPGPVMMGTNTFLLFTEGGHAAAIDPAAPAGRYLDALNEKNAQLRAIFLTHGHYDHVGSAVALARATGAALYLDPRDLKGDRLFPLRAGDADFQPWPAGGALTLDELTFRFYHTPGHTPGSVCIYVEGLLFSGDTLFAGSCGRVDLDGGDPAAMRQSLLLLKNLPLPDDTRVFPGHDRFTTLGEERLTNYYLAGPGL